MDAVAETAGGKQGGDAMTFDDWMRARNPKYCPTDDTVALRELRDCWRTAEHHSARAQERERMIELMRDKCRKVGADETAKPVAWIRFCSDGCYEGPIMDEQIENVRKNSGAWTPLYARHNA
jgi:hypothetical protein